MRKAARHVRLGAALIAFLLPGLGWAQSPPPEAPALINNFNGISYTFSYPPDPVIAAGPASLVLVTNGSVTIRDKTGALVASTSLASFFSSVRVSGENAFDPKVVFDTGSSRFFLLAVGRVSNSSCIPGACVSHFFLAVSKTSSPATTGSGDWYFYAFDATLDGATATANWADYPGLGVDSQVVVLTANMFSFSSNSFQKAKIRILDKSILAAGGAVTWTDFYGMTDPTTGFTSFTLQPALTFGNPGTFFLVSASSTYGSCNIVVWAIANPLTTPTLSSRTASASGTCLSPPDAQQLGGGTPLDTGDKRLYNAVYRNGAIWTAQSIQMNFGSGNVSAVRWLQIDVSGWPGSVSFTQDSTFGADGIWYFYPTVMVDSSNNLALVLARSNASEYGSAYYTGRLSTDSANTLQPSALLKAGTANQNLVDGYGRNRYGDYLGIGLDPSDGSFWMLGEYVVTSSSWGTWVGNFRFISKASMASPVPGSTLTGGSETFTWSDGAGASQYWLEIGSTLGGVDRYSASQGTNLSRTVNNLPVDGRTLYVRLWTLLPSGWQYNDYTYTAATVATAKAEMVSPASGSTLAGASVTFTWSAGTGASQYWLEIGSTLGGKNLYSASQGTNLSRLVSGLPVDGRALYVRLWTLLPSGWQYNDYTYTAATVATAKAVMTSPASGSTLAGASVTFTWSAGTAASQYWLEIGSTSGGVDRYSVSQGTNLSVTVNTLPIDGRALYVRLWTLLPSGWQYNDYTYTAATVATAKAVMTSPASGSTLAGASVTFTWSAGTGASQYWLEIGSTSGGVDRYSVSQGTNLSVTVSNLPTDGRTLYVRLWTLLPSGWQYNNYTYTAATVIAVMTSPASGSTLAGASVTFTWSAGTAASQYWLEIGSTLGGVDRYSVSQGTNLSVTVSNLPTDGRTLYVRLWSRLASGWQYKDYTYRAALQ